MIFKDKEINKKYKNLFLTFFPKGKKGMEIWQLVLIILALLLLFFIIAWYGGLNKSLEGLIDRFLGFT